MRHRRLKSKVYGSTRYIHAARKPDTAQSEQESVTHPGSEKREFWGFQGLVPEIFVVNLGDFFRQNY